MLWTVGRGWVLPSPQATRAVATGAHLTFGFIRIQKIRQDGENLYFNAESPWRWCEFTAHPRVTLYADRTGAELTDIRVRGASGWGRTWAVGRWDSVLFLSPFQEKPAGSHTLFQISSTPECRRGERLSLCRYLGLVHPFHHLITTQVGRRSPPEVCQEPGLTRTPRGSVSSSTPPTSWTSALQPCRWSSWITCCRPRPSFPTWFRVRAPPQRPPRSCWAPAGLRRS